MKLQNHGNEGEKRRSEEKGRKRRGKKTMVALLAEKHKKKHLALSYERGS